MSAEDLAADRTSVELAIERLSLGRVRGENWFLYHLTWWLAVSVFLLVVNLLATPRELWSVFPIWFWGVAVLTHGFFVFVAGASRSRRTRERLTRELDRQAVEGKTAVATKIDELRQRLRQSVEKAKEAVRSTSSETVAELARGESAGLSIVAWLDEAERSLGAADDERELRGEVVSSLSRPGAVSKRADLQRLLGQLDVRDVKLAALESEATRRRSLLESFLLLLDSAGLAGADEAVLSAVSRSIRERVNLLESAGSSPASASVAAIDSRPRSEIEQEVRLARDLQRSILPREAPVIPGLSIAHLYHPSSEVGGDFFDFYETAADRLLVAVGDASGHGLDSSMISSMAKSALYTQVSAARRPDQAMAELNRMMCDTLGRRRLMTLALIEFELEERRLRYVNAGQVFPLLLRGGEVSELEQPGYPLGVRGESVFSTVEHRLEPGDLYVLLTDGFVEAMNESGRPYGWKRLMARMRSLGAIGARGVLEGLEADLAEYLAGEPLQDDVTLVVISFEP